MLKNSFCHIPGIGPKWEHRLWTQGIRSWESYLEHDSPRLPSRKAHIVGGFVERSLDELDNENVGFFSEHLPSDQHWRLYPEFRHSIAYFDIETTGQQNNFITTIALYDGYDIRHYVHGRNMAAFPADIQRYKLIVTYNGKGFDVPFIEQTFGIQIKAAHIDLRYVLRSLGYGSGLKTCEKQLGIDRGALAGLDGYAAVLLWQEFTRTGSEAALETLLAYNIADVVNLETLMVHAYNMKVKRTPFAESHDRVVPPAPTMPFAADLATLERIKRRYVLRSR